ncbi:MAG: hypothetical protein K0M47_18470, partial [Rhizobium sp.]|nr:hypothetical protein [Rhizobium sp.]
MFIFPNLFSVVFCSTAASMSSVQRAGSLPSRREPDYHSLKWIDGQVLSLEIAAKSGKLLKQLEKQA